MTPFRFYFGSDRTASDMTQGIVQADIDFALRLMDAGCRDSAIIASLCWRGVGASEAVQLLESLRNNRPINLAWPPSVRPCTRRSRSHGGRREHHRRKPFRTFRRYFMRATMSLACVFVLFCFVYVLDAAWVGAHQTAAHNASRYPGLGTRMDRFYKDLPDTVCDKF
jgi:hypothetical protein